MTMNAKETMKMIKAKLAEIQAEIARLRTREQLLMELVAEANGETVLTNEPRKRSQNVKPVVLDIMASVGLAGATSREVSEKVRAAIPTVATDTVGSVLSRLKSDGALAYDGERYYEKRFAPPPRPEGGGLRAVN